MTINSITCYNVLQLYGENQPVEVQQEGVSKVDEISFSKEAVSFARILAEARVAGEGRCEEELIHIAEITQQVRDGSYHVDSMELADRMIGQLGWAFWE